MTLYPISFLKKPFSQFNFSKFSWIFFLASLYVFESDINNNIGTNTTIPVQQGWNMVGTSLDGQLVDVDGDIIISNTLSSYQSGAYTIGSNNSLVAHAGYVFKASKSGNLRIDT